MIHLIKGNSRDFQAVANRQCRKTGTMLFSIETLFFNCSDELTIFDDGGSGIAVIRIYPEDVQAENS